MASRHAIRQKSLDKEATLSLYEFIVYMNGDRGRVDAVKDWLHRRGRVLVIDACASTSDQRVVRAQFNGDYREFKREFGVFCGYWRKID